MGVLIATGTTGRFGTWFPGPRTANGERASTGVETTPPAPRSLGGPLRGCSPHPQGASVGTEVIRLAARWNRYHCDGKGSDLPQEPDTLHSRREGFTATGEFRRGRRRVDRHAPGEPEPTVGGRFVAKSRQTSRKGGTRVLPGLFPGPSLVLETPDFWRGVGVECFTHPERLSPEPRIPRFQSLRLHLPFTRFILRKHRHVFLQEAGGREQRADLSGE